MIYADTDFFLALLKPTDWLKKSAKRLLKVHGSQIRTSETTLMELLLLAARYDLDPERLLLDVISMASVQDARVDCFLLAAHYMREKDVRPFDALHAAFCGTDRIISSDKVFDRLGLDRVSLRNA